MTLREINSLSPARSERVTFTQDFRRLFTSGLAALLPTLITLWLLVWVWNFLWDSLGIHLIAALKLLWPNSYLASRLRDDEFGTRLFGVVIAIIAVYIVGFFVGNLIGRTFWLVGERMVMRVPIVRAIYPAVKQVTDFLLANRQKQFESSRVVAVEPHAKGIWSIGLVTGPGLQPLSAATGDDMVTVFIPSSPTAITGYVVIVPRVSVVELPLTVEDAMRMLVSGGVLSPDPSRGKGSALPTGDVMISVTPPPADGRVP